MPSSLTPRTDQQADDRGEDYGRWPLSDRLELLAFEAELAHLPRTLIAALWEADRHGSGHISPTFRPSQR